MGIKREIEPGGYTNVPHIWSTTLSTEQIGKSIQSPKQPVEDSESKNYHVSEHGRVGRVLPTPHSQN